MIQRFTLDPPSFERILSALSLVQQLKKQIPQAFISDPDEAPFSVLVETQQDIETEAVDLDAALTRVVTLAGQLTPATGAAIWFFTGDDFVCRTASDGIAEDERLRLEVLARLAAVSDAAERDECRQAPVDAGRVRSLLVAPIHQGRNLVGGLAIWSPVPDGFGERDGIRARLLGGLVAHALRKAADAELRQIVSLERAAMLEAMDQIMPALRRLVDGERERCETAATAVAEIEPASSLTPGPPLDVFDGTGFPRQRTGRGGLEGAAAAAVEEAIRKAEDEPNVFLFLQKETEQEQSVGRAEEVSPQARGPAVEVAPGAERLSAEAMQPGAASAEGGAVALSDGGLKAAAGAGAGADRRAFDWIGAARAWTARTLEVLGATVMRWAGNVGTHLREAATPVMATTMSGPRRLWRGRGGLWAAIASARRRKTAAEARVPVRPASTGSAKPVSGPGEAKVSGRRKRRQVARRAAGPALLVLVAAGSWILMRSAGAPDAKVADGEATASVKADEGTPEEPAAIAPATVPVKLSSAPMLTAASLSLGDASTKATESANRAPAIEQEDRKTAGSHLRVTDHKAALELATLSRFEIAGLRRQAQYGDDSAALLLGMAYETGRGVRQNCVKAREWVTRAAEAGNAAAQYNLGLRYREGDGVAADPDLAEKWLNRAAARKYSGD